MIEMPSTPPPFDLREELARIDQRHAELMTEVRAIKLVTTMTFVYGAFMMLVPLALGAALVKLFS